MRTRFFYAEKVFQSWKRRSISLSVALEPFKRGFTRLLSSFRRRATKSFLPIGPYIRDRKSSSTVPAPPDLFGGLVARAVDLVKHHAQDRYCERAEKSLIIAFHNEINTMK